MIGARIQKVFGRQIFDSRGRPTVEVEVTLDDGSGGRAAVPSGASTGAFEACELRDGDLRFFQGLGVQRAIAHVNTEIAAELQEQDALNQPEIDALLRALDGTPNLARLGANAVLGASLAVARAAADFLKMPLYQWIAELSETAAISLPVPMVNILSGGLHAGGGMDVQDLLFVPTGARSFDESLAQIAAVRAAADVVAREKDLPVLLADEGGLSPGCASVDEALALMTEIATRAGLTPGTDAGFALDVAAATLQRGPEEYFFARENCRRSSAAMIDCVEEWSRRFPLVSIEDPLGDEDWANWSRLGERLGAAVQLVGDDLLATDRPRVERAIEARAVSAVLVKPNQNGTLTGTLDVIKTAREQALATIVSARSGETEDSFIADLAVGTDAGQIKIGSFRNAERMSKYNRLIRIQEESGAPFRRWPPGENAAK